MIEDVPGMPAAGPGPVTLPASGLFVLAAWFGFAGSAAEVVPRLLQISLLHGIQYYGVAAVWMIPVVNLALFCSAAALIAGLRPLLAPPLAVRAALLTFAFLMWLSVTLLLPRLHWIAETVLAVGLAMQTARVLEPRIAGFRRLAARSVPVMAAVVALAGAATGIWPGVAERRALAALPAADRAHPNVLLLILDTVRSSSLSLFGARLRTSPRLDALAARGVAFEHAIAPAPYTLASHASYFTGAWPRDLGITWTTPLPAGTPTLAERFAGAGYRTAGFSANRIYVTRSSGLARGFLHFDEYADNIGEMARNASLTRAIVSIAVVRRLFHYSDILGRKHAAEENREILHWLGGSGGRPWFVFANYFDAHSPYLPAAPCDTAFGWYSASTPPAERHRLRELARHEPASLEPRQARAQEAAYDGAIACLDAAVGDLLDTLGARGQLTNTVIVVASDHGEEFGEHGVFGHGNSLYLQSLRVPLIVVHEGHVPAGRRVTSTVSLRNLAATIADLAGLPGAAFPGVSLRAHWADAAPPDTGVALAAVPFARGLPASFPVSKGDLSSIVTRRYQLIAGAAGDTTAFDLAADPTGTRALPAIPDSARPLLPLLHRH